MTFKMTCAALVATGLVLCAHPAFAQEPDSTRIEQLQEVVVSAVRAAKDAPFAVTNIGRRELRDFSSTGRELPMLFSRTPGVIAWSENGVGTGTTYLRIRGAGGSRINVTLDGVPLNSPEDQSVFWANMNSYARLLGSVQIQRGVGTSTNGDGAFGGTIALATSTPSTTMESSLSFAYGSHNTLHLGSRFSSGLRWDRLVLDAATYLTRTDGYLPGTNGLSGNYYGGISYLGGSRKISYKIIGNYEITGQAWNGVVAGNDDLSLMDGTYGTRTGIKTYKDLYDAGLGLYNPLYERLVIDSTDPLSYKLERYRMNDGSYWPRTTDNFWQTHQLLNFTTAFSGTGKFSATAHYTNGHGWYDEFRDNNKLPKFGIPNFTDAGGNTIRRSDFVRRKGLTQHTWGLTSHLAFTKDRWDVITGISVQLFTGRHYGQLTYVGNEELADRLLAGGPYPYYESDASKFDGSAFAKASFKLSQSWSVFGDIQIRHVNYKTSGYNDKYIVASDGSISKHTLDINARYLFNNPKAGVNFSHGAHRVYASFAASNREPERNNFTDNGKYSAPRAEQLYDFETGYQLEGRRIRTGVNLYYMRYRDQLVQTGELSDIGEALTTNIPRSYRTGIEWTAGCDPAAWLTLEANAALSRNRLLDFDEYVDDWDKGTTVIHYNHSPLAYSPSAILNGFVNVHYQGFRAQWHTGFVSRMYLDNTGNADRSLPAYSLTDLSLGHTLRFKRFLKEIDFGVEMNNLFNARVAQSGWVYSAICESAGHTNDNRYYQIGFIPVAGLTVLGHINLRF